MKNLDEGKEIDETKARARWHGQLLKLIPVITE